MAKPKLNEVVEGGEDPKKLLQRCYVLYAQEISKLENEETPMPREHMISLETMVRTLLMTVKEERYQSIESNLEELEEHELYKVAQEAAKYLQEPKNVKTLL